MTRGAAFVASLAALLVCVSCGGGMPAIALPTGAGVPAPDAITAWTEATASCRDATTFSSQLRLSGRIGPSRRSATVHVGMTSGGDIRLEVPAPFGRPAFTLAGTEARATLLTRDDHVLTAPAREIVDAITGISLAPGALFAVLTGCGAAGNTAVSGTRYGELVGVTVAGQRVLMRSRDGRWRVVAAEIPGLLVEYDDGRPGPWPTRLRITSTADAATPLTLTATQQQVVANEPFPPGAFTLMPPPGAVPVSVEDLKRAVAGGR